MTSTEALDQELIEKLLKKYALTLKDLQKASLSLSELYRLKKPIKTPSLSLKEHLSYCLARFPATYGAICEVLTHLPKEQQYGSLLDLGCGPATATKAAFDLLRGLEKAHLIDHDPFMLELAQEVLTVCLSAQTVHKKVTFERASLLALASDETYDLVILPYVLGEIQQQDHLNVLTRAFSKTNKALVIITPGRPFDKEYLLKARESLLSLGAFIFAPCSHSLDCPLKKSDNWCHFTKRIVRTSFHRYLKNATLGFEDEKFSYLIVTKSPCVPEVNNRLIGPIFEPKGCLELSLCTKEGKWSKELIRKKSSDYKLLKKKKWGEGVQLTDSDS